MSSVREVTASTWRQLASRLPPSRRRRLAWLSLVSVVPLLLGGIVGFVLVDSHTSSSPAPRVQGTLQIRGAVDAFHRPPDAVALGSFPGGPTWQSAKGTWGIDNEQAYVAAPTGATDLAVLAPSVVPAGVQVRVATVTSDVGLVFRYRDPGNYWAVVAVPYYGTWAVVRVLDGRRSVLANTGLAPVGDGTIVAVHLQGATIEVAVNGRLTRALTDVALQSATSVGLTAGGQGAGRARFEDFRLATDSGPAPTSPAPIPPSSAASNSPVPPAVPSTTGSKQGASPAGGRTAASSTRTGRRSGLPVRSPSP